MFQCLRKLKWPNPERQFRNNAPGICCCPLLRNRISPCHKKQTWRKSSIQNRQRVTRSNVPNPTCAARNLHDVQLSSKPITRCVHQQTMGAQTKISPRGGIQWFSMLIFSNIAATASGIPPSSDKKKLLSFMLEGWTNLPFVSRWTHMLWSMSNDKNGCLRSVQMPLLPFLCNQAGFTKISTESHHQAHRHDWPPRHSEINFAKDDCPYPLIIFSTAEYIAVKVLM